MVMASRLNLPTRSSSHLTRPKARDTRIIIAAETAITTGLIVTITNETITIITIIDTITGLMKILVIIVRIIIIIVIIVIVIQA